MSSARSGPLVSAQAASASSPGTSEQAVVQAISLAQASFRRWLEANRDENGSWTGHPTT